MEIDEVQQREVEKEPEEGLEEIHKRFLAHSEILSFKKGNGSVHLVID